MLFYKSVPLRCQTAAPFAACRYPLRSVQEHDTNVLKLASYGFEKYQFIDPCKDAATLLQSKSRFSPTDAVWMVRSKDLISKRTVNKY